MESLQCPELSPGWRQIILGMVPTLLTLVTEQGVETEEKYFGANTTELVSDKPVEVGHEGLDSQFWVDG